MKGRSSRYPIQLLATLAVGMVYWWLTGRRAGVTEPWDAAAYWSVAYPLSLLLSALAGFRFRAHAWSAGAAITFAQLPVIALQGAVGPLLGAGLVILALLSIPAMGLAALAGRLARRRRRH